MITQKAKEFLLMKTGIKNGGKISWKTGLLLLNICILCCGCSLFDMSSENKIPFHSIKEFRPELNYAFVSENFCNDTPIAYLTGVTPYKEKELSFDVIADSKIKIYATGEIAPDFMDVNTDCLYKSDEIELYFDISNIRSDILLNQEGRCSYYFNWLDGKVKDNHLFFYKQGCEYSGWYDTAQRNYIVEIKVPWKNFNILELKGDTTLLFDVIAGDNDDSFNQKGKKSWHNDKNEYKKNNFNYGVLFISQTNSDKVNPDTLFPLFGHPVIDYRIDPIWNSISFQYLTHSIFGFIPDEDFSAAFKTIWDKDALYFLIKVHDPGKKNLKSSNIRKLHTLCDYGWLEDEKGNKVWEMHLSDCEYSGGGKKNVKLSSDIYLKKGKYKLKYFSDESHAWNNWDDSPPQVPFYGIVIFDNKY